MADLPIGNEDNLNGTTWVTAIAAPAAATQRIVGSVVVYNADTVAHTLEGRKKKGANTYQFFKATNVPAGGRAIVVARDNPQNLDATDESVEVRSDAAATTTEPTLTAAAMETT